MNYDLLNLFLKNNTILTWKRNEGAPCISAIFKDYNISLCLYKDENSLEFVAVNIDKIFNGIKKDIFNKRIYNNENTFHLLRNMYIQGYQNSKVIGAFANAI